MLDYGLEVKFHYGEGYCGLVVDLNKNPADPHYSVGYILRDWCPEVNKKKWSYYSSADKLLRDFEKAYVYCQYEADRRYKAFTKSKDKVGLYSYLSGVLTRTHFEP